jgi:hypothetical protein
MPEHATPPGTRSPGPWSVRPLRTALAIVDAGGECVAVVPPGQDTKHADAQLLASSPQTLHALQLLYRICLDCDLEDQQRRPTEEDYQAAMDAAEQAIQAAGPTHAAANSTGR